MKTIYAHDEEFHSSIREVAFANQGTIIINDKGKYGQRLYYFRAKDGEYVINVNVMHVKDYGYVLESYLSTPDHNYHAKNSNTRNYSYPDMEQKALADINELEQLSETLFPVLKRGVAS